MTLEPDQRFIWFLCSEIFGCLPNDPRITEMDMITKMWMFEMWLGDKEDDAELAKNHAYLLASFSHPEAVKSLIGQGGTTFVSTEEEFEESTRMMGEINRRQTLEKSAGTRKRSRRLLNG